MCVEGVLERMKGRVQETVAEAELETQMFRFPLELMNQLELVFTYKGQQESAQDIFTLKPSHMWSVF